MATPNYDINYNDNRFTKVNNEKSAALTDMEKTYGGMISGSDKYYQQQVDATKQWGETQKKNQQAQTDFAIEQINQQKAQAEKDYIKEQSGAYVDWQKQSNAYGVDAEQKAAAGMANSGYSESSKVAMYTTWQNRVISARESFERAKLNYDNKIQEARLQNNAKLAEIAFQTLQKSLELSLQGFQYKNQLIIEKANKKTELEQIYHERYQDVLDQINKENELAERVRQHDETIAENRRQHDAEMEEQRKQREDSRQRWEQEQDLARRQFEWQKAQAAKSSSSSGGSSGGGGSGGKLKGGAKAGSNYQKGNADGKLKIPTPKAGGTKTSGKDYLNALIRSGASKDKVSNEIALALRNGAITKKEAAALRATFTPRGLQY